ncbi:MAG TPA: amino acid permease [Vicinamibacterales bacterium]|nr:amino acid permease [Vicinamibacterales bacterium]
MTTPTATTTQTLERRLGPLDAAAIIVSNVIGGGILFLPPLIASNVPNPMLFLGIWLAGGFLAFCGAMAYAELAALRPRAGGEYVYLREAYGSLAGFLTGWTSFVAGFAGAMAASAMFLVLYLDRFVPGVANNTPFFSVPLPFLTFTFSRQTLVAIIAVWLFAFVHIRGVGPGRVFTNLLTVLKITAFLVFIAIGFAMGAGSSANLEQAAGPVAPTSWLLALIPVMFTYSGWNAAAYMAEEVRNPGRNVPLALAIGTAAVTVVYLLINVLYLYVMPIGELAAMKGSVLDVVAERLLGVRAGDIMGIVSIISLAAGINAWTFAGPRVYYAMARDGVFFPAAARVHPKYKTPSTSIIAQASWATLLILTGSLDALANYVGFAITLFAGVAVAAVFVLRRREPNAPRPFKAIGYPVTPAIFVLVSIAMVVNAFYRDPVIALTGAAVILAGIPLYLWFTRRTKN